MCAQIPFCNDKSNFTDKDVTNNSMYASNTTGTTIVVVLGGTLVSLPNNQDLDGFVVNGANTIFTVPVSGRYYLTYQVNTTATLLSNTRLIRNGSPIPGSIISPIISTSNFNSDVILFLNQNDTISLQLFGIIGVATLLGGGATGASLSVIRLS